MRSAVLGALALAGASAERHSAVWSAEKVKEWGYKEQVHSPLPHTYVQDSDVPTDFSWGNVDGVSYLTKSLNQHIPQYCGSCWAHGAVSALGDRIKIARKAQGVDVNLAVQHVLNCGNAGTCYGGNSGPAYQWIAGNSDGIVYDTCNPYLACSWDSAQGFCLNVNTTCQPENICRTCSTFSSMGGFCTAIDKFPNATVAEHGNVRGEDQMKKELYARGPLACAVDATSLITYKGGIASGKCSQGADHAISVVGWGVEDGKDYWIVRNSWGEFWGELGFFRVERGNGNSLCVEETGCAWATPKTWTEHNFPCGEDGTDCSDHGKYVDPSTHGVPLGKKYTM